MVSVKVYDQEAMEECNIKFVVIVAFYNNKLVVVRHKRRQSWELPGGHREIDESPEEAARRELYEETGATKVLLDLAGIYSVCINDAVTFGKFYYAQIKELARLPESEIAEVNIVDDIPDDLTYPEIQPLLYKTVLERYKLYKKE